MRQEDSYDFEPQRNGEHTLRIVGGGSVHKRFLKTGETLKDGIVVTKLFDLNRAGQYTVRVQRRDDATRSVVVSNKITLTTSD